MNEELRRLRSIQIHLEERIMVLQERIELLKIDVPPDKFPRIGMGYADSFQITSDILQKTEEKKI